MFVPHSNNNNKLVELVELNHTELQIRNYFQQSNLTIGQ